MKKALYMILTVCLTWQMTACGFTLRGYHEPVAQIKQTTTLNFGNGFADIRLKNALKETLNQLSIKTSSENSQNANIEVKNISLQKFQLRGVLTEIRMVMSADVSYFVVKNGQTLQKTQRIQAQRSYQYDQASVNIDNPQADQIQNWLYDNLAQQIADQYMALQLAQPAT